MGFDDRPYFDFKPPKEQIEEIFLREWRKEGANSSTGFSYSNRAALGLVNYWVPKIVEAAGVDKNLPRIAGEDGTLKTDTGKPLIVLTLPTEVHERVRENILNPGPKTPGLLKNGTLAAPSVTG